MRSQSLLILPLLAAALFSPHRANAQWKTPWTYEGPTGAAHWSRLDPDYAACNTGREQSPIDIRDAVPADLPDLRFAYLPGPLQYLINNGYTIRVNYHDAPGAGNFLIIGDTRYHLTQFHFHRPSEEFVHGKPWAMEVHLMHESADGKVVGVTVFLKAGRPNPTVQQIWDHMPPARGHEQSIPGVTIDPTSLLPRDNAYFRYMGSLSAPPCTEDVTWIVLRTPVEVSPAQIAAFSALYPHDVRPLQPLNGRAIQTSR
ncbi:MAG TPA: carbonic anhydrase family protein [Acidobacteriaceae bacterium]|nr:carbonic anhydrase family protein [Acidobacteriaceae bacterium]